MNSWLSSLVLVLCTLGLQNANAQEFDGPYSDSSSSLEDMDADKRRPATELFGKRAPPLDELFDRDVRQTQELFGKRQSHLIPSYLRGELQAPTKRRGRELFGKRSVPIAALSDEQMETLASLLTKRQRRARGGELFG